MHYFLCSKYLVLETKYQSANDQAVNLNNTTKENQKGDSVKEIELVARRLSISW